MLILLVEKFRHDYPDSERLYLVGNHETRRPKSMSFLVGMVLALCFLPLIDKSAHGTRVHGWGVLIPWAIDCTRTLPLQ